MDKKHCLNNGEILTKDDLLIADNNVYIPATGRNIVNETFLTVLKEPTEKRITPIKIKNIVRPTDL